jgi:hypothetical protein
MPGPEKPITFEQNDAALIALGHCLLFRNGGPQPDGQLWVMFTRAPMLTSMAEIAQIPD